jgi:hypothetical protein
MKTIFAVFTLLLLGSVSSATTITEPSTFTLTAHSISGPARTITFTFASDPPVAPPNSDSITISHTGSGTFCLPAGTTFIPESSDTPFTFTCSGFQFPSPGVFSINFQEPNGDLSDALLVFNQPGGSQGAFVSVPTIAEPAGLALLGSGLLVLAGVLRRRTRRNSTRNTPGTLS